MSKHSDMIKKAREEVASSAPAKPAPTPTPAFHVSDESKRAIDTIMGEMDRAATTAAPSETPSSVIPDTQRIDDAFNESATPPSLASASVARRKQIEARCGDVEIDELFVSGEVRQEVVIRPGRLVVTYRTLKGKEDLYIKRRLSEVKHENMRYAEDRFLYMLLCAHIYAYNGKKLPSIFDDNGVIQDKLFDKRFDFVAEIPQMIMEEVWVNYVWFERRVKKALEAENLNNG
jgi:hypothetical protein